jgi:hypothetical protein
MITTPVLIILVIIVVIVLGGGGYYYRSNPTMNRGPYFGVVGLIIALLVIYYLLQLTGILKSGSLGPGEPNVRWALLALRGFS